MQRPPMWPFEQNGYFVGDGVTRPRPDGPRVTARSARPDGPQPHSGPEPYNRRRGPQGGPLSCTPAIEQNNRYFVQKDTGWLPVSFYCSCQENHGGTVRQRWAPQARRLAKSRRSGSYPLAPPSPEGRDGREGRSPAPQRKKRAAHLSVSHPRGVFAPPCTNIVPRSQGPVKPQTPPAAARPKAALCAAPAPGAGGSEGKRSAAAAAAAAAPRGMRRCMPCPGWRSQRKAARRSGARPTRRAGRSRSAAGGQAREGAASRRPAAAGRRSEEAQGGGAARATGCARPPERRSRARGAEATGQPERSPEGPPGPTLRPHRGRGEGCGRRPERGVNVRSTPV